MCILHYYGISVHFYNLPLYFIKPIRYNRITISTKTIIPTEEGTMAHQKRDEMKDYLFQAILSLQSIDDCYNFFDDQIGRAHV